MLNIKSILEPYRASKWLSVALLIDQDEMQSLFKSLGSFLIFTVGSVVKQGEGSVAHELFLSNYANYVTTLQKGLIPEDSSYRSLFSSVFTLAADHLYAQHVGNDGQITRVSRPVVQLQAHNLDYSKADEKFHPMVFGKDSILWGIQFSYPQLFEDPKTHAPVKVDNSIYFPNTTLFKTIQKWTRDYTVPTPFFVDNKMIHVPMRLGKNCFSWINHHPQLGKKKIRVQYQ